MVILMIIMTMKDLTNVAYSPETARTRNSQCRAKSSVCSLLRKTVSDGDGPDDDR